MFGMKALNDLNYYQINKKFIEKSEYPRDLAFMVATIFALSTPLGRSGLCIFRISGPKAFEVFQFIKIEVYNLLGFKYIMQQRFIKEA